MTPREVSDNNRAISNHEVDNTMMPRGTGMVIANNADGSHRGTFIDERGQGGLTAGQGEPQGRARNNAPSDPRESYRAQLQERALNPNRYGTTASGRASDALREMDSADQSLAGTKYSSDASLMGNRMSNQYNMWAKNGELNQKKISDLNPDFDPKDGTKRIENGPATTGAMARLTGTLAGMTDNRTGQPVNINDLNNNDIMKFQELHKAAKTADDWNSSITGKLINTIQGNHPEFSNDANDYRKTGQDSGAVYPQSSDRLGNRQSLRSQDNPKGEWLKPVMDHNARMARAEQIQQESHARGLRDAQGTGRPQSPTERAVNKRMDAAYNHSN